MSFAASHPGALTGHFLAMVHARLSAGQVTKSSQLRQVPCTQWAQNHANVSEVRDQKEILTLATVIDQVNANELGTALDVIVQRIQAIQNAKVKGGSWEKAQKMELVLAPGEVQMAHGIQKLVG